MDPSALKTQLITIIGQIQADSGLECPPLVGATKPVGSVPKFDSKIWPIATTILSLTIEKAIPNDVNIFIDEKTKLARTINEIAAFVCKLVEEQDKSLAVAA